MKHVNVNKKMKVFSGLNIKALRMRATDSYSVGKLNRIAMRKLYKLTYFLMTLK